jgi:hypothetical protein
MKIVNDISELDDGFEITPGITLLGKPEFVVNKWRCLANVNGMLAVNYVDN